MTALVISCIAFAVSVINAIYAIRDYRRIKAANRAAIGGSGGGKIR